MNASLSNARKYQECQADGSHVGGSECVHRHWRNGSKTTEVHGMRRVKEEGWTTFGSHAGEPQPPANLLPCVPSSHSPVHPFVRLSFNFPIMSLFVDVSSTVGRVSDLLFQLVRKNAVRAVAGSWHHTKTG